MDVHKLANSKQQEVISFQNNNQDNTTGVFNNSKTSVVSNVGIYNTTTNEIN